MDDTTIERTTHFDPTPWDDMTHADHIAAGHMEVRIIDPDSKITTTMAHSWVENPTGSLSLRRVVYLDLDHPVVTIFKTYAPGKWASVESQGHSYDLEAILDQELAQDEEAQRQIAEQEVAAVRARIAGGPVLIPPNRAARRNSVH